MAERRMFAKTIIDSDAFLDMPMSARLLYYDLSMRADDDGFVNSPKKIMRMIGATQDDLSILVLRKFIIPFDNGVVVIKHWYIHNYIRKDTYNETPYKEQKQMLELDENKSYRLIDGNYTACLPTVDEPSTQDRLGKDSIGKDKKNNIKDPKHKHGEYQHVLLTDKEMNKLIETYGKDIAERAVEFLDAYIEEKGYKAKSHYLTIRRWVIDAVKEKKNNGRPGHDVRRNEEDDKELDEAVERFLAGDYDDEPLF
jgi:hypothetical protein